MNARNVLCFGLILCGSAWGQGYLEGAGCAAISGWAWDSTQPNTSISVNIFDSNTLLATVPANIYRGDLQAAGMGNGNHGFTFSTPASLKDGQTHYIRAASGLLGGFNPGFVPLNCPAGSTGYQPYYSDTLGALNTNNWYANGSVNFGAAGLSSVDGGDLVSKVPVPDGTASYEVKVSLTLTASGGYYIALLRSGNDTLLNSTATGTTYAVELVNPTFSGNSCTGTMMIRKIVSGTVYDVAAATTPWAGAANRTGKQSA